MFQVPPPMKVLHPVLMHSASRQGNFDSLPASTLASNRSGNAYNNNNPGSNGVILHTLTAGETTSEKKQIDAQLEESQQYQSVADLRRIEQERQESNRETSLKRQQQSQQLLENMAKLRELEVQRNDLLEVADSYRK